MQVAHLPVLAALGPQEGQLAVRRRVLRWVVRLLGLYAVATVDAAPKVLLAPAVVADVDAAAAVVGDDAVAAAVMVAAAVAVGVAIL